MNTNLDITKGLHTDNDYIAQPVGTYRHLQNAVRQRSGAIESERGTVLIKKFATEGKRVVGSYVLDDDIIIFSHDPLVQESEIGILEANNNYKVITKDPSLKFSTSVIISAEGKRNFKGERIIYFTGKGLPMRVLNLDDVPLINFDDVTKLVLTADMPQIKLALVEEGGTVSTGVYQFGVRLLTKSTNATSISLLTNPIPIIDEDSSNRDRADGAPPQTDSSKAINLSITNIDTDYEFIEVVAITYIGTANTVQASVVGRIPIQNRSVIDFTYTSSSQNREALDINGLVVDASNYDSAEFIIQKDGILILGGLSTSSIDYNFQSAANKVKIKYVIKEVEWQESVSISNGVDIGTGYPVGESYKNSAVSTNLRSYMRDEVYSFAITPIFTNWSMGGAYHIPGTINISAPANPETKSLGTYVSDEIYPLGRDYPVGNVRHHKMPSLIQEPHVVERNGRTYIRLLGVSVDLTDFLLAIPATTKKEIIGYVITKQKRDEENKSILAQGIANGHILYEQSRYTAAPFSGNTTMYSTTNPSDLSMVAFYSPETTITRENMRSSTQIKPVLQLKGKSHLVRDKREGDNKFVHILLNYSFSTTSTAILGSNRDLDTSSTQYVDAGPEKNNEDAGSNLPTTPIVGTTNSVVTWRNPGYLFLKIKSGVLPLEGLSGGRDIHYEFRSSRTDILTFNGRDANTGPGDTQRHLYNLTRPRTRQYGNVFDAKYHYVNHVMVKENKSVIECFNGDIYITKFAVMTSMNPGTGQEQSATLQALNYFWVESTINTAYRHYKAAKGTEGEEGFEAGTLPYYPKIKVLSTTDSKSLGIFNYSLSLGHPTGYNKQYSFENTIRSYFPPALELEKVSKFPNRLIYSEQSIEGEQLDAFRILLANNYHDVPKEKGKITNIFTLGNTLYVHTERSLWRTYFNEQVTQASSAGEVYLGNGGVFYRPSTEVTTVKGGYAGTTSTCGTTTPFGHLFPDTSQKKIFMLTDTLNEISDQGMFNWFRDNLTKEDNTPAEGKGYVASYDFTNKRWLLTKLGEWTLSYNTQLESWSSYHDYKPYHYIANGDRLFSMTENKIYENNIGKYGVYYGAVPASLQLDIVINDVAQATKTFDNLVFYTTSENGSQEQHYDTFNTLHCYNDSKNTGKCRLIVPRKFVDDFITLGTYECFAKLKSNEFRVAIPSDLVLDVSRDIFDESNLDTDREFRPRMSGKYLVASLSYNNYRNNRFVLHNIGKLFRQRIR